MWVRVLFAAFAMALSSTSAQSAIIVTLYGFSATSPDPTFSNPAGSFEIAYDTEADSYTLTDIDYASDFFRFTLDDVGMRRTSGPALTIGGLAQGVTGLLGSSNDFRITFNPVTLQTAFGFSWTVPTRPQILIANGLAVRVISTSVPEPRGWALLIAGFGLTGASIRLRQLDRLTARVAAGPG